MIYLRIGTRLLFIRSKNPENTRNRFLQLPEYREVTLEEGQSQSDENNSLLFITNAGIDLTDPDDAEHIILAPCNGTEVLSEVVNRNLFEDIDHIDMGPRILVLRVPDKEEEIIQRLAEDYQGQIVSYNDGVRIGEKNQTLLGLTRERLQQAIDAKGFYDKLILIDEPLPHCYAQLRREALLYITHSLEDSAWYEYRINLYDSYENYKLHYDRLIEVVSGLEMGFILGEQWTKDHALMLLSVLAYQVRFFSFFKPENVKRILVGLEYDDQGNRLADFDLYYRNKKVRWNDIVADGGTSKGKRNKKEEGITFRKELLEKLPSATKEELFRLEKKIIDKLNRSK